jgi:hypothetical protein
MQECDIEAPGANATFIFKCNGAIAFGSKFSPEDESVITRYNCEGETFIMNEISTEKSEAEASSESADAKVGKMLQDSCRCGKCISGIACSGLSALGVEGSPIHHACLLCNLCSLQQNAVQSCWMKGDAFTAAPSCPVHTK